MPAKQKFKYLVSGNAGEVNFTFPVESITLNQAATEALVKLREVLGIGKLSVTYIQKTAIGHEPASDQVKSKEVREMFRRTLPSKERSSTYYGEFSLHKYVGNSMIGRFSIERVKDKGNSNQGLIPSSTSVTGGF